MLIFKTCLRAMFSKSKWVTASVATVLHYYVKPQHISYLQVPFFSLTLLQGAP